MSGNVYEWCLTKWRDNYWTPADDALGSGDVRVVRGGCYRSYPRGLRCAARHGSNPFDPVSYYSGFRVVVVPHRL
jgi:formylglycine-generating enzyme required for sulfatase activity